MNILIFSMTYFPFVGGAEVAVREITDRIGKHTPNPSQEGNKKNFLLSAGLGCVDNNVPDMSDRVSVTVDNSVDKGKDARFRVSTTADDGCFEFDLITAKLDKNLPDVEKIGNVNVYRVGRGWKLDKYLYPWQAYKKAKELHKKRNYKIVEAVMAFYGGLAALFFKWKFPEVKYLLNMQSGDSDLFVWLRTWFWHPLYKKIYTKPDFIQPISKWLERRARRYGYKGEIEIVPNGVDVGKFKILDFRLQIVEVRKKFGISENDKVIITVSRLVKKNGVGDLIRGLKEIEKLEIKKLGKGNTRLLIAGSGKLENKLKGLVKKLELQDRVLFLGHIGHNELPKYLWASDIFCRPSLTEGFGNVFVEAMAAGLPVIATPVGGIPDFLIDGETGIFCKVKNPESIADAVVKLLNDKALYDKIAKNGFRLVEERYDWNKIAGEMARIYRKLIR